MYSKIVTIITKLNAVCSSITTNDQTAKIKIQVSIISRLHAIINRLKNGRLIDCRV